MPATTIKVPPELRDRINRDAGKRGLTASALLEELVSGYERQRRLEAFGRAFAGRVTSVAGTVDDATMREVEVWLRDFLDL